MSVVERLSRWNLYPGWRGGKKSTGYDYAVLDQFITGEAAPLSSPRSAEPLGTATIVDTNNILYIADGRLHWDGTGAVGTRIYYDSLSASPGRGWGWSVPVRDVVDTRPWFGVVTAPGNINFHVAGARYVNSSIIRVYEAATNILQSYTLGANEHQFAFIERESGGGFLLARNGLTGPFKLLHVYRRVLGDRQFQIILETATNNVFEADNIFSVQLGGRWKTDWALTTDYSDAPADEETLTHEADGIVELAWTPASLETLDIQFRRTDDNNCWIVRCSEALDRVFLYEKVSGVEVERGAAGGVSRTFNAGTEYRMVIRFENESIWVIYESAAGGIQTVTYTSAAFNKTETQAKVTGFTTAVDFASWPIEVALPGPFEYSVPESSVLEVVSYEPLWSAEEEPNWLGRPVLLETSGGIWISAYAAFEMHNPTLGDEIHLRFSEDQGITWTEPNVYLNESPVSGAPFFAQTENKAVIECVLFEAPNGDLILHAYERPESGTSPGTSQWRSTDGGPTWVYEGIIEDDTATLTTTDIISSDDFVIVDSTIYVLTRIDAGADFAHPHLLALIASTDNATTWEFVGWVENTLDINEAGLLHTGGSTLIAYVKDTVNLHTYRYQSSDLGVNWGGREYVTNQLGIMNKPRCKTIGSHHWVFGRDVRDAKRTVVYRSADGLNFDGRFYPIPGAIEDTGYCDMLRRDDGTYYMQTYGGDLETASIYQCIFKEKG